MLEKYSKLNRVLCTCILSIAMCSIKSVASADHGFDVLQERILGTEKLVQERIRLVPLTDARTIIIGGTGSGKSTLMNIFAGIQLVVKTDADERCLLDTVTPSSISKIGHVDSETTIPNLWRDEGKGVLFCDCPGSSDTRGSQQRIINEFAINQLFLSPGTGGVKVLLVMSEQELLANRGEDAKKQFESLKELLPDTTQREKMLGLVITKTMGPPPLSIVGRLGGPRLVFNFPCPASDTAGKNYNVETAFPDFSKLLSFPKENPIVSPVHSIALGKEAELALRGIALIFGTVDGLANSFVKKIKQRFVGNRGNFRAGKEKNLCWRSIRKASYSSEFC